MEISTKTLQSDRSKHATLFVALELNKATWLVALNSPIADKISEHRIDGGDTAKLLALIEAKRLRAEGQLGLPVRVCAATKPDTTASGCTASLLRIASTTAFSIRRRFWSTGGRAGRRPIGSTMRRCSGH